MSDTAEFLKVLSNWKDQQKKIIFDVLKRVDGINLQKQKYDDFDIINKAIFDFHREIQNCDRDLIDTDWFAQCLKIKNKLKKVSLTIKKKVDQKPVLTKKPSQNIQYPSQLFEQIRPSEKQVVKIIYKNFVSNLPNYQEVVKDKRLVQFIKQVNLQLRKMFQDQLDIKKNKRVDSICMHLSKQGAIGAKVEMLEGKKTAKQIAQDSQSAYRDEQTERKLKQYLNQQFQMSETGFYDNMKKDLFKGASQECRYCRKPTAYCDDMKQIRAADQPMTRFMKCNTCGKNWRD